MDLVEVARMGSTAGATSALGFGRNRRNQAEEKAEAVQLGAGVETQEQMEKKVRQVAEDFVSVFMNQITKSMRANVHENEKLHGDNGEKFFQELLDTEYSKSLAKGSGYGLTDLIYESMMTSYRVQQSQSAGEADPQTDRLQQEQALLEEPELAVEQVSQ